MLPIAVANECMEVMWHKVPCLLQASWRPSVKRGMLFARITMHFTSLAGCRNWKSTPFGACPGGWHNLNVHEQTEDRVALCPLDAAMHYEI